MKIRVPLRFTLLSLMTMTLVTTYSLIWFNAREGLRQSVYVSAEDIGMEAIQRVRLNVRQLLDDAEGAANLVANQLHRYESTMPQHEDGLPNEQTLMELNASLIAFPELCSLGITYGHTGEFAVVFRDRNRIGAELSRVDGHGKYDRYELILERERFKTTMVRRHVDFDVRVHPPYKLAQRTKKPGWTGAFLFVATDGSTHPGILYEVPEFREDGRLHNVVMAGFTSEALSRFLQTVKVGDTGTPFILDDRPGQSPLLVAHPDAKKEITRVGGRVELTQVLNSNQPLIAQAIEKAQQSAATQKLPLSTHTNIGEDEYFVAYDRFMGEGQPSLSLGLVVPAKELTNHLNEHEAVIAQAALLSLAWGMCLCLIIAYSVSRPLNAAANQISEAAKFNLDLPPTQHSIISEVDSLAFGVDQLKTGLGAFRKYVPSDLVHRILNSGTEPVIGGETREITVHFCDVTGFSSAVERMDPQILMELLSELFGELSEAILDSGGTVDKYIGDNVMAFWGAPQPMPDHAYRAVTTALLNQARMKQLRDGWRRRGLPQLHTRTGLHSGETIVGNLGSAKRFNYTAIGSTVNLTNRIEALNKSYGTEILISQSTYEAVSSRILCRPVDLVRVAGKQDPLMVYEPLLVAEGAPEEILRITEEIVTLSETGLREYRSGNWAQAAEAYNALLAINAEDPVATVLRRRCRTIAFESDTLTLNTSYSQTK